MFVTFIFFCPLLKLSTFRLYRDTRAYILDLASKNFKIDFKLCEILIFS